MVSDIATSTHAHQETPGKIKVFFKPRFTRRAVDIQNLFLDPLDRLHSILICSGKAMFRGKTIVNRQDESGEVRSHVTACLMESKSCSTVKNKATSMIVNNEREFGVLRRI
jgi:hypothetical protein